MKTQNIILLAILFVLIIAVVIQFGPELKEITTGTAENVGRVVQHNKDNGRVGKARTEIANLGVALSQYNLDVGTYPSTEQGLDALWRAPSQDVANWDGPYYIKDPMMLRDPWGSDYQYRYPGSHYGVPYDLFSYGADGKLGGEDLNADITNWGDEDW